MADIYSALSPEQALEQQRLTRQQQFANALMQQNQQPQGQMVSGRYVAPSFFQYLQPAANMLTGAYLSNKADEKSLALAKQLRQAEIEAVTNWTDMNKGREATPEVRTELAGPYGANMGEGTLNVPKPEAVVAAKPAMPANPEAANMAALLNPNAPAWLKQAAGKKITEGPSWQEVSQYNPKTGNTETYVFDKNSPNPESTKRFVGVSKPAITAAEAIRLRDEGITGGGGYGGNMPVNQPTINQGSPILAKPAISVVPNAPAYAQDVLTMKQPPAAGTNPYAEFNASLKAPSNLPPKAQREWFAKANEPLSGEASKQVTGAINTVAAIDDYRKLLEDYSKLKIISPTQRSTLEAARNTMNLYAKEAYNLGVLNGPDLDLMNSLTIDPNSPKSLIVGRDLIDKLAEKQRNVMGGVVQNVYGTQQKRIPDYVINKLQPKMPTKAEIGEANAPLQFNSEADAQRAGIKKGTRVVINGVSGTWN